MDPSVSAWAQRIEQDLAQRGAVVGVEVAAFGRVLTASVALGTGEEYTGRHAALSVQLSAGVDPADVARRAGNSIEVLLRVYAKFIAGMDEINNKKIDRLLGGISYGEGASPRGEPIDE